MGKTVGAFDFDIGMDGARVVPCSSPLMAGCLSDDEVDACILLLKKDLDAVARRMKAAIEKHKRQPLFGSL
jgi:hypothetical protein